MVQIQFIAQTTEEGNVAPGIQGRGPQSLGMGCGTHMGTESGKGIEVGQIALNGQPLDGIGVITAPDLRAVTQHTQVKPVAAGGTAFQQYLRSGTEDPSKHII